MARYRGPKCKLCRREGMKLFLKGHSCLKNKCDLTKGPPGPPPKRRRKKSDYAVQLREKQKVKVVYGVLERPFRNYFKEAVRMKGITGENLLILLERRLDNTVYRMGIGASRSQARNMVFQGHIRVNGKKVDIASYRINLNDKITISEKFRNSTTIETNVEVAAGVGLVADWIKLDDGGKSGEVARLPAREDVDIPFNEQIIVEFYSK